MHFPRTSGISIKKEFSKIDKNIVAVYSRKSKNVLYDKRIKLLSCGHCWFGIHKLWDKHVKYFALVRNPIYRVISSYYFILNKKDTIYKQYINNLNLEDWIDSNFGFGIDNLQVRMLVPDLMPSNLDGFYVKTWLNNDYKEVTKAHYKTAIKNISNYFCLIDIMDNRNSFLERLGNILHFKFKGLHLNKSISDYNVSNNVIKKLKNREKWDMELYNHIQKNY
jgi:hypothetical protein